MSEDKKPLFKGTVGKILEHEAEEGKVLITLNVNDLVHGPRQRDQDTLMIAASIFKHILKPHFSHHSIEAENISVIVEVPEALLNPEWDAYFKSFQNSPGAHFELSDTPVTDELRKIIPEVIIDNQPFDILGEEE